MAVYIIAEIGQAHDGSLGILFSYISEIAKTDVNAIKFQMHIPEAESSDFEPFRINFSLEDNSRFDYWKRTGFSFNQWEQIKNHCDKLNVEFLCSPFSLLAVDWLEKLKVKRYKIGSGEVSNHLLLRKIAETRKPVILSSGLSNWDDLDSAFSVLKKYNSGEVSVLQCTTKYPTAPNDIGLNVINLLRKRYNCSVGLSDHSGSIFPSLAAVSQGSNIVEFHAVFHKGMFGPDTKASLTIEEINYLTSGIRQIEIMLNSSLEKDNSPKKNELKIIFGKSLCLSKNLKKGDVITFEDLESKKPAGKGIPASEFENILGKELKDDLSKWSFLNKNNLK